MLGGVAKAGAEHRSDSNTASGTAFHLSSGLGRAYCNFALCLLRRVSAHFVEVPGKPKPTTTFLIKFDQSVIQREAMNKQQR